MNRDRAGASRWILLAILLLALFLRAHRLGAQSLWYDEAVTAQVTQQGLAELARWTADDIQPPLYYALVAGWMKIAPPGMAGESQLRFPSLLFGLAMVGLAYRLARHLFGPGAGLIAALLGAVHPLWLYYSQEARMYTLLAALGMATGYALLQVLAHSPEAGDQGHAVEPPAEARRRRIWWLVWLACAAALLYTHYFGAFLLLAFAAYAGLAVARAPSGLRRRLLAEGSLASLALVLAYLPWLPNALRRLQEDASYWQGTLKLDEALRHLAISLTTGETVLEAQAIPLAVGGMILALLSLAMLIWNLEIQHSKSQFPNPNFQIPNPRYPSLFAAIYLFLPILFILALSYRTPKFNPRYLMLASPGLILLLAGALSLPFGPQGRSRDGWQGLGRRLTALAVLGVLLAVFAYADRNWFVDPAFTKDDWRGTTAYVRARLEADERVILVSGHALPAWQYYAPDLPPLRLPELEILDVNAVLDLEVAGALNDGLAGKQGAWLVQWQQEVVDPSGVVPFLLNTVGEEQSVNRSFWGLGAPRHFRFPEPIRPDPNTEGASFSAQPSPQQALAINFDGQVELVGLSQPPCTPVEAQPCPLVLFWRALQPLTTDLKLSAILFDQAGNAWSQPLDRRLAAYEYPTFRWQLGQVVLSQLPIVPDLGTPPGTYRLRLSVYDATGGQELEVIGPNGASLGPWQWLEPVVISQVSTAGTGQAPAQTGALAAAPGLQLLDLQASPTQAIPGQQLRLATWWLAQQPAGEDYAIGWRWIGPDGRMGDLTGRQPDLPSSQWPAGTPLQLKFAVHTPAEAQEGQWWLEMGLLDLDREAGFIGETARRAVTLVPVQRSFEAPPVQYPSGATLGTRVELLGIDTVPPQQAQPPGGSIPVTVTWRALAEMEVSYTGFVHLLDASGRLVSQEDHLPLLGQRPTTGWVEGEVIQDRYILSLPEDLPAGIYDLAIGLYDAGRPGLPRLPASTGGDSVLLGQILVQE